MSKVLVVYHSMSGNTRQMAEAVAEGARSVSGMEVEVKEALAATIDELLECDGIALGSPDYFSEMAGGMKDFFDRTYYPAQGQVTDKPCVIFGSAGGLPSVVIESLRKMAERFKLREAAEPVGGAGTPTEAVLEECRELGQKLAEAAQKPDS